VSWSIPLLLYDPVSELYGFQTDCQPFVDPSLGLEDRSDPLSKILLTLTLTYGIGVTNIRIRVW